MHSGEWLELQWRTQLGSGLENHGRMSNPADTGPVHCGSKPKRFAIGIAPLGTVSIGIVPMGVVCIRCGRTEEFESAPVIQAGQAAANHHGFDLIESTLNVRGICPDCR